MERRKCRMKQIIKVTSFILCVLVLFACSAPPDVKQPEKQAEEATGEGKQEINSEDPLEQLVSVKMGDLENLKGEVASKEEYLQSIEKELTYYKEYVKSISQTMSEENKMKLIEKEWSYSLTVNGVEFPKTGTLTLNQPTFDLVIKEERTPYSVLSEEDSMKGKITTDIKRAFQLTNEFVTNSEKTDDLLQEMTYKATNVPIDTVITAQISEELQQKLQLDVNQLTIVIQ